MDLAVRHAVRMHGRRACQPLAQSLSICFRYDIYAWHNLVISVMARIIRLLRGIGRMSCMPTSSADARGWMDG